jgi:hypothetical protein
MVGLEVGRSLWHLVQNNISQAKLTFSFPFRCAFCFAMSFLETLLRHRNVSTLPVSLQHAGDFRHCACRRA